MREDGQLLQMIVRLFYSEMIAENGIAPARIDHVASAEVSRGTVGGEGKIDIFI